MNIKEEAIYGALLRTRFDVFKKKVFQTLSRGVPFLDNWHSQLVSHALERVARGDVNRQILNLPPRSLKSVAASIALPAWYLGHNPSGEVICASYGQDLALKFGHDCRTIMQTPWYQAIFPTRIAPSKSAADDFRTIQGGSRLATSVGGAMTGRGADLVVVDDPAKPDEMLSEPVRDGVNRWMFSTVYSRLNNKETARIVVAMQRLHVMDLTGYLIREGGWDVLRLAAIAETDEEHTIELLNGELRTFRRKEGEVLHPERESLESIQRTRAALGSYFFSAQYQQTPMVPDGNIVKLPWFARYDEIPDRFDQVMQSWDTASKTGERNSYSVCTTWGLKGKQIFLIDVFRRRLEYPDLKRAVMDQIRLYKPTVILVEEKSSGAALIQELVRDGVYGVKEVKPQGSKEMRMSTQTALIEGGFVHLPKNAAWLQAYEEEIMLFPIGEYDDQVDSTSQALSHIQEQMQEPAGITFLKMEHARLGIPLPVVKKFGS